MGAPWQVSDAEISSKINFSWELGLQNWQNRFADANRPQCETQVTLPQGLGGVILFAPALVT